MEKNDANLKKNDRGQIREIFNGILEKNKETLKRKIYERLITINDGVIAIILTIMALEIHIPVGSNGYSSFLMDIGMYAISFFIVANFWYEMNSIFSTLESITHFQVILNLMFLVLLSLFPVLTKWIMFDLSKLAVVNYGIVYFITRLLLYIIYYSAKKKQLKASGEHNFGHIIDKMMRVRITTLIIMNIVLILIASYNPLLGMILYISLPICSFMWPNRRRRKYKFK